MSLPRYPEYKDSGVEWLGKVPSHWPVMNIKRLSMVQRGASPRPIDDPKYFDNDGEFSWVRIADVSASTGTLETTTQRMSELGASLSVKVLPGDLFVSIAGTVGKPCITNIKACIHDGFVYFPTLTIAPKFLFRVFEAGTCYAGLGKQGTQLNLNTDTIGFIPVAVPPTEEMAVLLTFLDRETGKIDALIAEQEKLLALLAEKRQATISHAVTKGLNPDAPMKDSGVAWLGEVPEHWEIKSIRHILEAIGDVDHFMPASDDKGVPYLMTGDLKEFVSDVSLDDCKQVSHNDYLELSKRIKSSKGDVIMARYATIGTLMYVDVDIDFLVSYSCVTLKTNHSKISGLYLFQYMKSDAFRQGVENQINTNTQGNVGIKDLQSVKIAVPPIDEQSVIAAFLDAETTKLDALKTESERAVALLKERRSALIAAAVIGQIDVRSLVTEPEAA